jgi:hypothetical protein
MRLLTSQRLSGHQSRGRHVTVRWVRSVLAFSSTRLIALLASCSLLKVCTSCNRLRQMLIWFSSVLVGFFGGQIEKDIGFDRLLALFPASIFVTDFPQSCCTYLQIKIRDHSNWKRPWIEQPSLSVDYIFIQKSEISIGLPRRLTLLKDKFSQ